MTYTSIYDPARYESVKKKYTKEQSRKGGATRIKATMRDAQGRVMPSREVERILWTLDPNHGVIGGRVRASTAKRIKGRFAKEN